MNPDEIKAIVFQQLCAVAPETEPSQVQLQQNLRDQLDLDSVDFLNFIIGLHKQFKIDIPEKDYPQLMTIESCVSYLSKKQSSATT